MEFRNEDTFGLGEEKVSKLFDDAVKKVRKDFGKRHPMYIGGKEVFSDEEVNTVTPIDRRIVIGVFQKGKTEHARAAIQSAKEAFYNVWRDYGWENRVKLIRRAGDEISKKKFEIAAILSYENGKNKGESLGEVDEAIDFCRYYAHLVEANNGLVVERGAYASSEKGTKLGYQGARSPGEMARIVSKPYGVWGVVAPFNFPFSISTGMCVAALVTGNTVVFKPSFGDNPTPYVGLKLYEALTGAGLPKGVINYVTGSGGVVGNELVENRDVKGIAFTGSLDVGLSMVRKFCDINTVKQFVAEMGSKNPAIVTKTADLDKAVNGVASAAFGFCGQKCSACSRAIVHEGVYDEFMKRLVERTNEIKVGNPLEGGVYMGPVIGKTAFERYMWAVDRARRDGKVVCRGRQLSGTELFDNGYYVEPTVIEVGTDSELWKKELFLPILIAVKFKKFEDAVRMANDTDYGLTAGLYTKDKREIEYFNRNIEFGTTYVNRDVSATTGAVVGAQSFVGCKNSSIRCKGTSSLSYLLEFVREHSETVVGP